jgi:valyl-tRNA synthetase
MEISPQYNPKTNEEKWYEFWMKNKLNHSEVDNTKKPFTIVIPPPNITGALHMGHALNNTIQDIFIRYKKMLGLNTCWIPGTDHGGIATQNVIEKQLLAKGTDKNKIGREKFLEIMWEWRNTTGDTILHQLRKLGCLCDWDRTRFTMDEVCAKAVFEAFKNLYDKGLIYRGTYMVNWCPRCHTALSDIEVEYNEQKSNLWHIKYPFKHDPSSGIIVATTRPETMLGDTAIAVNPDDERYKNLIGKTVIIPLINREIPIIADSMVEKEFGTGAVKITPSHDVNDYETAKRHNLPHIVVIDLHGKMTENADKYSGLDRYIARKQIVNDLEEQNLLVKIENHNNNVGVCYRCNTIIEPLVSDQWYLKTKDMAHLAINAVKDKHTTFTPESWEKPYLAWLENLRDWCISRQIWWGHRIPIWYCKNCHNEKNNSSNGIIVSMNKPEKCPKCNSKEFTQDTDVLDTWFSSSLWPFSTLGWPEENKDLNYYYPTSVLSTGHEILYLWVARMIMMGLYFRKQVPFKQVYLHGIVRDAKGKKMSKSLGNVIDPLDIIKEYGTDALRFSITTNSIMGRDLHLSTDSFLNGRNFCNKLWNASRLILTNLEKFKSESDFSIGADLSKLNLELSDKWILSILQKTIDDATKEYNKNDFANSSRIMYEFVWNIYCDWYLEIVKSRLYGTNIEDKKTAYSVLIHVLKNILILLHPIAPFITEEIWYNLNMICSNNHKSLLLETWPAQNKSLINLDAEKNMQIIIDIVTGVRNIRGEMNIPLSKSIELYINLSNDKFIDDLSISYLKQITKSLNVTQKQNIEKPESSAVSVIGNYEIYIPLKNLIDFSKEKQRIEKDLKNTENEIQRLNEKLENKNFVDRAPSIEVENTRNKKIDAEKRLQKLKENLKSLL